MLKIDYYKCRECDIYFEWADPYRFVVNPPCPKCDKCHTFRKIGSPPHKIYGYCYKNEYLGRDIMSGKKEGWE